MIKQSDVLSNKVKISLGKNIDMEWDNEDKLNYLINNCINIENNIKEINNIDNDIKKCNDLNKIIISFIPDEENKINEFIGIINSFGKIIEYSNFLNESSILSSKSNYSFIIKEIEERYNKIYSYKLIYKATRDGDSIKNFLINVMELINFID